MLKNINSLSAQEFRLRLRWGSIRIGTNALFKRNCLRLGGACGMDGLDPRRRRTGNRVGTIIPRMHSLQIRVTYQETDGQGRVHHGNYLNYFERGRVEMLRAAGISYKQLEADGLMLVVSEMNVRYAVAAEFDDVLTLTTEVTEVRKVRIRHRYSIHRGPELVVEADSVIACIDRDGNPRRLPHIFFDE